MAAFSSIQAALHKSAAGQHLVSEIKTAEQIEYAVDCDMVQMSTSSPQNALYVVGRQRPFGFLQHLQHQLAWPGGLVATNLQSPDRVLDHDRIIQGKRNKCNIVAISLRE